MIKLFKKFRESEAGAVTVDWVVLTAAVVALAAAGYGTIKTNTETLSGKVGEAMMAKDPTK